MPAAPVEVIQAQLDAVQDLKDVMFDVPPSVLSSDDPLQRVTLSQFLAPLSENVAELAGERTRLSEEQLRQIWESGTFEVPSRVFPGQKHVWQLSVLLVKGRAPMREALFESWAAALGLLIESVPALLWRREEGGAFNFLSGVKSAVVAVLDVPRQVLGGLEREWQEPSRDETRRAVLEEELGVRQEDCKAAVEEGLQFVTCRDGTQLFMKMADAVTCLQEPFEREVMRPWELEQALRRQELCQELAAAEGLTESALRQRVADAEGRMLIEKTMAWVAQRQNGALVCDHLAAVAELRNSIEASRAAEANARSAFEQQLSTRFRSRIASWRARQMLTWCRSWQKQNPRDSVLRSVLQKVRGQDALLLGKNVATLDGPEIDRRIKALSHYAPQRIFELWFRIWFPRNWNITVTETRKKKKKRYSVSKYNVHRVRSSVPGWRVGLAVVRGAMIRNNVSYFAVANCFFGPFGLRSLFGLEDFQPDRTVDRKTGELVPTGPVFSTLFSRVRALWRHMAASRAAFEASPDRGLLTKSATRPFNLLWNFVVKGIVGTSFALAFHLSLAALNFGASVATAVTAPLMAAVGSVGCYVLSQLVYDFDSPNNDRVFFPLPRLVLGDFLIFGLVPMVLTPVASAALCVASVVRGGLAAVGWVARSAYDRVMWWLAKRHGRVPETDSFLAHRIAGPGLSSSYIQQVRPSFAVLMVQYLLDQMAVAQWRERKEKELGAAVQELESYYAQFIGVGLAQCDGEKMRQFRDTRANLCRVMDECISRHNEKLIIDGCVYNDMVRMSAAELGQAVELGRGLCERFVAGGQINNLPQFWADRGLVPGDCEGLCKTLLKQAFNAQILQPIEEADAAGFRLQVEHVTFDRFFAMVKDAKQMRDDLERPAVVNSTMQSEQIPEPGFAVVTPRNVMPMCEFEPLLSFDL